jgi:hypothetical protein
LWNPEFNEKCLLVLRLRTGCANKQVTRALLRQAQVQAQKYNLEKVITWNTNIIDEFIKEEIEETILYHHLHGITMIAET